MTHFLIKSEIIYGFPKNYANNGECKQEKNVHTEINKCYCTKVLV